MPETNILMLQHEMDTGQLTAVDLTERYLQRIAEIDQAGPGLRAVIEINPEAREIAAALDEERQESGARSPLHGIPVLLKDNIDTGDRMLTTAGSLALAGAPAPQDATIVRQLRDAGAIILGKANLSEWANFRSNHSTSGWSSRGGQTRNPYALDRNPCGSSSGSAVAVAAELCTVAVGTETDGSIICPAHANGVVGLKPTVGLASRGGIVPIAHSQDTAGPMGRSVVDVAVLLGYLATQEPDPRDEATRENPHPGYHDYLQYLDRHGLRGARLGIARNFFGIHPAVDRIMERCIAVMRANGAEILDPANVATPKELDDSEREVLLYEFKADLDAYLAERGPGVEVHALADVIDFNQRHRDEVMPFFGQETMLRAAEKGPLSDDAYRQALATSKRLARDDGIDATLRANQLDAIVAPSAGPAWLTDHLNGNHYSGSSTTPAAVAGYPSITVPAGYVWGLPVGISFFTGAYGEGTLLKLAFAFEQATQVRKPPRFLPSADPKAR